MPRKPGRPKPSSGKAKRVRPSARPIRFREEPVVTRARIAAAGESLKILSGPPTALGTIELARSIHELTDRSIGHIHAACHDGHRVACRSGCDLPPNSGPGVMRVRGRGSSRYRPGGAERPPA